MQKGSRERFNPRFFTSEVTTSARGKPATTKRPELLSGALLSTLNTAIKKASQAKGKDCIVLVGKTGVGKSTTVNYLLGCKMQRHKIDNRRKVIRVNGREIAKIGHSRVNSETIYSEIYRSRDDPSLMFCDTGGILESRGIEVEIAASVSTRLVLSAAKSIKLIICIDYRELDVSRNSGFIETLQHTLSLLKDYTQHSHSIMFLFTNAYDNGELITLRELRDDLIDLAKKAGGSDKALLEFVAANAAHRVQLCNPIDEAERPSLLLAIKDLKPIQTRVDQFSMVYSPETYLKLKKHMEPTAICGIRLCENIMAIQERYSSKMQRGKQLAVEKERLLARFYSWTTRNSLYIDPEQLSVNIQGIQSSIEQDNKKLDIIFPQKVCLKEKIFRQKQLLLKNEKILKSLEARNEEVSYWTDEINEPARFRNEPHTVQKTERRLAYVPVMTLFGPTILPVAYEVQVDVRELRRVGEKHTKRFHYHGIDISRVKKTPLSRGRWLTEHRSAQAYSVTFESEAGQPAHAKIEIFVSYKNLPDVANKISWLKALTLPQQRDTYHAMLEKQWSLEEKEKWILREVEKSKHQLERLSEFEDQLWEKNQACLDNHYACQDLKKSAKIHLSSKPEFASRLTLLKQFLDISQDQRMRCNRVIVRFLQTERLYQTMLASSSYVLPDVTSEPVLSSFNSLSL